MFKKICFAYPWATAGGCERVFLNRAVELCRNFPELKIDMFFKEDLGGVSLLRDFLVAHCIEARVSVKLCYEGPYDCVFAIDFPEIVKYSGRDRVIWECHTPYKENRVYLKTLNIADSLILFPSETFRNTILQEIPSLPPEKSVVLQNFTLRSEGDACVPSFGGWRRRPILFFGRMDNMKDPITLLKAYKEMQKKGRGDEFFLLFVGGKTDAVDMHHQLRKHGLVGHTILLPPVPFAKTDVFLEMVSRQGGVFVSPSHGESYGFSAAEALTHGIPSALTDILEHRRLIAPYDEECVFPVGDYSRLADLILVLADDYEGWRGRMFATAAASSQGQFMRQFKMIMSRLGVLCAE